jgi:hypothetical protein
MCPFCIANAAILAAGVTSTGGITTFVAKKFSRRARSKKAPGNRAAVTGANSEFRFSQGNFLRDFLRATSTRRNRSAGS